MNELMLRVAGLMGQVTLLALAAAALDAALTRRRPAAGSSVATVGLGGLLLLTLLAALPLPGWSWSAWLHRQDPALPASTTAPRAATSDDRSASRDAEATTTAATTGGSAVQPVAPVWSLGVLGQLWQQLRPVLGGAGAWHPAWSASVLSILLAGVSLGVTRLLLGLAAICLCRRNSRPVEDPVLLAALAALCQAMGCRRAIEVRESADLGGPVTIGWRHPLVLLPPVWRGWTKEELQAVLAHEVAHVCRADYAAWLTARWSMALHFYHPLVHWLVARLQLQQELAADALGAHYAGGRAVYLRSLVRLALRQEEGISVGPARAFLPVHKTLTRRIAMLRTTEKGTCKSWLRPAAGLLLGLVAAGVAGLRLPAQAPGEPVALSPETPIVPLGKESAQTHRPPLVYCYCPPDAAGFFAFRPSAYFGAGPQMKPTADEANKLIAEAMKMLGAPESLPKLEEIEQISGGMFVKYQEKAPPGERGMLLGSLLTLRTVAAYDWKKRIVSLAVKVTEVPCAGYSYYKVLANDLNPAVLGMLAGAAAQEDRCLYFLIPDDRTLVIGSEQQFQQLMRQGPDAKPSWARAAGWDQVESSILAVALTNQEQRFAKLWLTSPSEEIPADIRTAVAKTTAVVLGIDHDGELRTNLFTACANQADAVTVANTILRWISKGQSILRADPAPAPEQTDPRLRWSQQLLDQMCVGLERATDRETPVLVHTRSHASLNLAEFYDLLSGAKMEAVEVKEK